MAAVDPEGWGSDDSRLLHWLRLKGVATTDELHEANIAPPDRADGIQEMLSALETRGLVRFWPGDPVRWQQTPAGRVHGEQLLAEALAALHGRDLAEQCYQRFLPLNREFLELCTRWQVREVNGERRPNDHIDERYDRGVIRQLGVLDAKIQPVVRELAEGAGRFGTYGERFGNALVCVESGLQDWFTKPGVDSYHTVWFQLHEDLLATLGYERSQEHS